MSRGAKGDETMTKALARFLAQRLVPDLKERARTPSVAEALRHRWEHERDARRTADSYDPWAERLVEQVGAAWILSCAFVRTLEDRGYLAQRRLAGPGAADSEHYFFELFPQLGARDYLLAIFREMAHLPGAADLFGPDHNAAWRLAPSNPVAQELLALWRTSTEERAPTWTFEGTDTRFLGDLYQWLSEDARERFALLQTPDFVEEFILDLTLNPAIEEFGLDTVRLIDPTCGSGHFLLGAFDRLFERRAAAKPGLDRRAHALAALAQVHGVDINPYAVEIARFRLTLSFLEKAGITRIADAPALKTNLVVADSLLHGAGSGNLRLSELAQDRRDWGDAQFTLDDEPEARRILGQGYHAVVGNPPYITCKDEALAGLYRERYRSCYRVFALAAPFTERFFQLGVEGGFVGLINANSFMKREFGKKLIQEVLPQLDLTHVLDTSGAFIPGHGTPTVILMGRNRRPVNGTVRVVMGKQGEPETPSEPAKGFVWSAVARNVSVPGYEDAFVSVADLHRGDLVAHPWALAGGVGKELKEALEAGAQVRLGQMMLSCGRVAHTGADECYVAPAAALIRGGLEPSQISTFVEGEVLRDWAMQEPTSCVFPYDDRGEVITEDPDDARLRWLWRFRTGLWLRREPGGTHKEIGFTWYQFSRFHPERFASGPGIAFAFVATHNHFVFDRGGKVFKQSAPVIKLTEGATEDDYIALLGYLNSSVLGYWGRQVFSCKGAQGVNEGIKAERWEQFLEYSATSLAKAPVPPAHPATAELARKAQALGEAQRALSADRVLREAPESLTVRLAECKQRWLLTLRQLAAVQERIDWQVYESFGLLTVRESAAVRGAFATAEGALTDVGLHPGHRAFEIVAARECAKTGTATAWFERNGYAAPDEIPSRYPKEVRDLLDTLVSIIDSNPQIALIEKPEYKRRWTLRDYDAETKVAATEFLLEALEGEVKSASSPVRARSGADAVLRNGKNREVAELLFGANEDLIERLAALAQNDQVPHISTLRFTPSGLEKRAAWERTWDLQRLEDAGKLNGQTMPVPPKYDSKDYSNATFWRLRGKLDVPKERFISYPGAERDDDKSPLIGWAGWDHLQRAQALAALYEERKTEDGWPKERLVPLLAGMLELMPWVKQWHNEPNPEFGDAKLGDYFEGYVTSEASALGVTLDELRAWKPAHGKAKRGRKPATKAKETT